jgi:hypothetical protein
MATLGSVLTPEQTVALERATAKQRRAELVKLLRMADQAILNRQPVSARRHLDMALRALGAR